MNDGVMEGLRLGAADVPGGPRRGWVVALVCVALPGALLAAGIAVPATLWSRLPSRVTDHWTLAGTANGTAPRLVPFVTLGVLAIVGIRLIAFGWAAPRKAGLARGRAVTGALALPRGRAAGSAPATAGAALIAVGLFLMAVETASVIMVTVVNLGGGGLRSASVGPAGLVGPFGGAALLAAFGGYLLRRYGGLGATDDGGPRPSLGLRAGERAVWTGRARSRWAWAAAVLLIVAGVIVGAAAAQWTPAVVLLVIGVMTLGFTSVRVTVATRGVTVGYGPLGLRLTRIPLRRIASAVALEQAPFSFGYRGNLFMIGAAAVIVRRGPALRLTLGDGKTFLVTVDDAATGAALLNDLIKAEPAGRLTQ
jgi:hypothetical protein